VLDWFTAIGTVGAVLVALYIGVIRDLLRRPRLSLAFEPGTSDAIVIRAERQESLGIYATEGMATVPIRFDVARLRLRVANGSGHLAAEDVEVTVTGARELNRPGQQLLRIDGQSLSFSNSSPIATRMTVSPGGERHVDLAHLEFEPKIKAERQQRVTIDVHPGPAAIEQRSLAEGALELELTVTARNADAVRHVLEIHFDGNDDPETIWQHLTVKNLRKLSSATQRPR